MQPNPGCSSPVGCGHLQIARLVGSTADSREKALSHRRASLPRPLLQGQFAPGVSTPLCPRLRYVPYWITVLPATDTWGQRLPVPASISCCSWLHPGALLVRALPGTCLISAPRVVLTTALGEMPLSRLWPLSCKGQSQLWALNWGLEALWRARGPEQPLPPDLHL